MCFFRKLVNLIIIGLVIIVSSNVLAKSKNTEVTKGDESLKSCLSESHTILMILCLKNKKFDLEKLKQTIPSNLVVFSALMKHTYEDIDESNAFFRFNSKTNKFYGKRLVADPPTKQVDPDHPVFDEFIKQVEASRAGKPE